MLHSMPWALKGALLCVNLYTQARLPSAATSAHTVVLLLAVEALFLLSAAAPSLLFSVAARARTNTHVTALGCYLLTAYAAACVLLREPHLHALLHVGLQFALLHLHYWQVHELRRHPKLMLFGGFWAALHALGALLLPGALLACGSPPGSLHAAHVAAVLFAGEALGFAATVQAKLLRACGEAYEAAVS
jgi:hypothetical protein